MPESVLSSMDDKKTKGSCYQCLLNAGCLQESDEVSAEAGSASSAASTDPD